MHVIFFNIKKNDTMPNTRTRKAPAGKARSSNGSSAQLEKLFTDSLKDLYWAEKHLVKELPRMQKAATTQQLKDAIDEHTAQTEEHVARLEHVFEMMGKKAQAKKCDGMEGLLKEGQTVLEETEGGSMTRDAGIIMSAQKVEHYEISAYGTLVALATTLGQNEVAEILTTTLEEEKQTDTLLSEIAENDINWEAEREGESEEEE
jgi:ferritin-like metal-binding protein YciE